MGIQKYLIKLIPLLLLMVLAKTSPAQNSHIEKTPDKKEHSPVISADSSTQFTYAAQTSSIEQLQQKLDSTEKSNNIIGMQAQAQIYSLEMRNLDLQKTKEKATIAFIVLAIVSGLLLAYAYYRRYLMMQTARKQALMVKQQQLATKVILEAEEAERQRIAKDLHDGVGQMMSAAKMNLSAIESQLDLQTEEQKMAFAKIIQLVDDSCKEIRSVSHNMMPNALLKNSLATAIREFIDKLDQKALKVHLYTEGLDERLDSNIETVLYRIIQECVNNVIKHSGANSLDISIIKEANEITATIEDNGKGFGNLSLNKHDGMGLKNIMSRVEFLKGAIDIDSAPGQGTLIALHIPL